MRFDVFLTEDAVGDLEGLHAYIAEHDSPAKADHVLDRIEDVIEQLATFPERGAHPRALLALGVREYRQVFFKPYSVVYRVIGKRVYVYLIADGRRDMQSLLARRLLGG
ncbi:MAG: type II toxin-antitoxin system RelE/ParE family toxin [Burkholderiaceae bacterium]|nr:type II toxin-antitoxin system RelE/ParE family toxin [Burkholderiaceae bacterium]